MKLKSIHIRNVGLVQDSKIVIEKPLVILYGQIRQGKTTYLNAVRWTCGAEFPEDIIRHGEKEASIELDFDGGLVSRSWYKNKEGKTTARAVMFVRDGKPVKNPSYELKRLMNPFLLNQDYLRNMGETERKKYFSEVFSCDTTELDTEAFNANRDAQSLRAEIKGYGEIDLTPAEKVDETALREKFTKLRIDHGRKIAIWRDECERAQASYQGNLAAANGHNAAVQQRADQHVTAKQRITEINEQITTLTAKREEIEKWLVDHPELTVLGLPPLTVLPAEPSTPNTAELEQAISNAAAANVRAEQFEKNKARAAERDAKELKLAGLEKRQRSIKAEKIAKLAKVTEETGIAGLAFNKEGEFTYNGTAAGMLSTSEIMKLTSELSALVPEGLGIELLDRGESLGKSIFDYIDKAKAHDLTILATVVGEKPANVPEDIGVFVVENGKATK